MFLTNNRKNWSDTSPLWTRVMLAMCISETFAPSY